MPVVAGQTTVSDATTLLKGFAPLVDGAATVSATFAAGGPVSLGLASVAGLAEIADVMSVLRGLVPTIADEVSIVVVGGIGSGLVVDIPRAGAASIRRRIAKTLAERRSRTRSYRGGPGPDYDIDDFYPGAPAGKVNIVIEAMENARMTAEAEKKSFEVEKAARALVAEIKVRNLRNIPPENRERGKLLAEIIERSTRQEQIDRKARMAYVRSFKGKK